MHMPHAYMHTCTCPCPCTRKTHKQECDDASACCDQSCRLAPGASCSGECCGADCTPRPSGGGGACEARGGLCLSGACLERGGDAPLWVNGASMQLVDGVSISALEIDTRLCPTQRGGAPTLNPKA